MEVRKLKHEVLRDRETKERIEEDLRAMVVESGAKPLTYTSYEPSGKRKEVPSFYDKLDGMATKIDVVACATY